MSQLYLRSLQIIKQNQSPSGAYVASPNFPTYRYSWLRDGSFIAYAMDLAGEVESSRAFHRWVHRTLQRYAWKLEILKEKKARGLTIHPDEFLHTRYTLEGEEGKEPWGNFQLDGYGAWLWAVAEHIKHIRSGERPVQEASPLSTSTGKTVAENFLEEISGSIDLVVDYLEHFWDWPNYDCWEEHPDKVHVATLAAIYGGLKSIHDLRPKPAIPPLLEAIRQKAIWEGGLQKHLTKYLGTEEVDASLLWAAVPFSLLDPNDPIMLNTVGRIETDLTPGPGRAGGVRRYRQDTYYGGGEWVLLTAWLGWYYSRQRRPEKALPLLRWIEDRADANGYLPEQVPENMNDPGYYEEWVRRWGPVATPLLWSHAMYLVLYLELEALGVLGQQPALEKPAAEA